jgi:RNA polymerase sigma-70 factor (ECF subfamily)
MLDEPADAADVVQEVFLKVFRNIGTFRAESSLKTWIYRIALNEARNQRRWFGRHRAKEVGLELDLQHWNGWDHEFTSTDWLEDNGQSPYEVALDHEMHSLVEQGLAQLSPNHRAALVLREVEGLTYDEIAEILEIPPGTVKSRILRARDCLRKELTALVKPHVATTATSSKRSEGDRFAANAMDRLEVQGRDAV